MTSNQSIGERLHLLRLELGWSAAECAYRLTLEINELIVPETWETWERAADHEPSMQTFLRYATTVSRMFGIDPDSLVHGPWNTPSSADVIALAEHTNGTSRESLK